MMNSLPAAVVVAVTLAPSLAAPAGVRVISQHVSVELDPPAHRAAILAALTLDGSGPLRLELAAAAQIDAITIDGVATAYESRPGAHAGTRSIALAVPAEAHTLVVRYAARFEDDVAAGEREGEIHNFSVDAHVGPAGVFLSEASAWHPRPLDADGRPVLHVVRTAIAPVEGWAFVASGDPRDGGPIERPRSIWQTPRPVDGAALAGNQHALVARVHETAHGAVEIVMHVAPEHRDLAHQFLDAAATYLDLYVPRLGPFPYRRFSIVENFFSSGFAYPGFTLLGPQVVAMAPRSLAPGYLDHELLHNWWGNGVYVDDRGGNWCEALTSYGANYWRRIADEGEAAGRDYRLGTLMKVSADPALDDGPLAAFGSADASRGGASRFVGYDKGAFVFMMLERVLAADPAAARERTWTVLRRFADAHLGRRAGWDDLRAAYEAEAGHSLAAFFDRWVGGHPVPVTPEAADPAAIARLREAFAPEPGLPVIEGADAGGPWVEIDPDLTCYRLLPPRQIVPLVGGTLGPGGVRVVADARPEAESIAARLGSSPDGENLFLIGAGAVREHAALLARADDRVEWSDPARSGFRVGGIAWDGPDHSLLHTMTHPDRPGRFVTVFLANGEAGWARLRLVPHYRRDTTVIWEGDRVVARRVHEPDRRLRPPA